MANEEGEAVFDERSQKALDAVRANIAQRWTNISKSKGTMDEQDFRALMNEAKEHLASLKVIHGREMVFGPWPALPCEKGEAQVPASTRLSTASHASSSSSGKNGSAAIVPHKFWYLCQNGTVWTVVQASEYNSRS